MKISCQSCQAKYTIADEKVLGKIVKIRCKKCSATIVINGNEQAASASSGGGGGGDGDVFDYTAQSGTEQWTVNVADGDQRTLTSQEIVAEYRAGVVNDETYCWKDGMPDWLPLREIDQLYASCTNRPSLAPELAYADQAPLSLGNPEPPAYDHHAEATATDQIPLSTTNGKNGNGGGGGLFGSTPPPAAVAAAPVAARRIGGRAGGGDLFGGASAAGGEEDVMTSAPVGTPEVQGDQKLTGQRNENSVLFSLTALTANEEKKPATSPVGDGSGLIDIRALSANMSDKREEKSSHVDDIMNLGGGGAFGAALAAPILAPPPIDSNDLGGGESSGGKNKSMVMFGVAGAVFLAMLGTIVFLVTRHPDAPVAQATGIPTAATVATTAPTDTTAPAATGTGTGAPMAMGGDPKGAGGTPAASPTDKPAAATAPKGGGGTSAPKGGGGGGGGGGAVAAVTPPPPDLPKAPKGGGGGGGLADAIKNSAGGGDAPPPPPPTASDKPFDRGAAAAALGGVNVGGCAKGDGPTGSGHISVTFGGDGSVISAVVDQPPFAGTPRGGCVAAKFRAVHIPAFSGGNVKVGKSFTIN